MLDHVRELIAKLESLGIHPSPEGEGEEDGDGWEDVDDSDDNGDVEMA